MAYHVKLRDASRTRRTPIFGKSELGEDRMCGLAVWLMAPFNLRHRLGLKWTFNLDNHVCVEYVNLITDNLTTDNHR